MTARPWAVIGGVAGPSVFLSAWVAGTLLADRYSPVHDPISRLAASGAPTRVLMTAGFVAYGIGVGARATAATGGERLALAISAVATIGVALTPLDAGVDGLHALAAGSSYAALAVLPLTGERRSVAVSMLIAAALLTSVVDGPPTGLFQRIGLTAGDAWIIARSLSRPPDLQRT